MLQVSRERAGAGGRARARQPLAGVPLTARPRSNRPRSWRKRRRPRRRRARAWRAPVGVAHDALHEVVVHEPEARDGRAQVEIDGVLGRHAPQVLGVAHPGQRADDLLVARHADVEPARARGAAHRPQAGPGRAPVL